MLLWVNDARMGELFETFVVYIQLRLVFYTKFTLRKTIFILLSRVSIHKASTYLLLKHYLVHCSIHAIDNESLGLC